jgi:thiol peroxidase
MRHQFQRIDVGLKPVTLQDTGNHVRIVSVIPSLDTPICAQTTVQRGGSEVAGRGRHRVSSLPFAQKRWCGQFGWTVKMLSDHKTGRSARTDQELRVKGRFCSGRREPDFARLVKVADHPDYEATSPRRGRGHGVSGV